MIQSKPSPFGDTRIAKSISTTAPLETAFQKVRASNPIIVDTQIDIDLEVLLRNLPLHYPHNNIYSLFPFCTPDSAIKCLTKNTQLPDNIDHSEYDHAAPKQSAVHSLTTKATISHVLNTPDIYHTPYRKCLEKLTDGYGYVVATF